MNFLALFNTILWPFFSIIALTREVSNILQCITYIFL